jgi:hypothetical protein
MSQDGRPTRSTAPHAREMLDMKAFISAVIAAVVIAVVAAFVLDRLDFSSARVYQSEHGNVRL